jgi:hypothetical protein
MAAGGELDCGHPGCDFGRTSGTGPTEAAGAGGADHGLAGGGELGGDAKKKSKRATQANAQTRAAFQDQQAELACEELIFLDEFGINLTMTRTYARAPRGQRAVVTEPCQQGPNFSVLSALGMDSLCAPFLIEGALNSEVFTRYVEQMLVPWLRPGHQVWLGAVHKQV